MEAELKRWPINNTVMVKGVKKDRGWNRQAWWILSGKGSTTIIPFYNPKEDMYLSMRWLLSDTSLYGPIGRRKKEAGSEISQRKVYVYRHGGHMCVTS